MNVLDNLKSILGAEVCCEVEAVEDRGAAVTTSRRIKARRLVSACERCSLRSGCSAPVPMRVPSASGAVRMVVVGEGPGKDEDRTGNPFVGPAGRLLRTALDRFGMDPAEEVGYVNVVSCYAHEGELGGKGVKPRAPQLNEMQACRTNLLAQLDAINCRYVLLAGATALNAWRSDLTLTTEVGRVGVWLDRWVVGVTVHPAAVLRNEAWNAAFVRSVERFVEVARGERDWRNSLSEHCSRGCNAYIKYLDPDGIGYCEQHYGRYGGVWKMERERWQGGSGIQVPGVVMKTVKGKKVEIHPGQQTL